MLQEPISQNVSIYKIMLGKGSTYAEECLKNGFVGVGWFANTSLIDSENPTYLRLREFNDRWVPEYLRTNPEKSKVTAGLACGSTFTVCFDMKIGDLVISPKGDGTYAVGVVTSNYQYDSQSKLPHQRKIDWFNKSISKEEISQQLRNSMGSIGTVINITGYTDEIKSILAELELTKPVLSVADRDVEDASIFALEQHLEDFLIQNWSNTDLSLNYDIYADDENFGKQFPTDTGRIDILAISKDKKQLLVIELKRGRVSDVVVGQIQRYMGFVQEELAEQGQSVRGLIIGLDDDIRIKRALSVTKNIEYYRYSVSFKLTKAY